jgi:hypothetical protein
MALDLMELSDAKQNWKELRSLLVRRVADADGGVSGVVIAAGQLAAKMSPPCGFVFNETTLAEYKRIVEAHASEAAAADIDAEIAALSSESTSS